MAASAWPLVGLLARASGSEPVTISTIAGGGAGRTPEGRQSELSAPRSAAVDQAGVIWFTDTGHHQSRRGYTGDGGPATAADLEDPRGLALAADGSLYISNAESVALPAVRRVDPAGVITTIAGGRPAGYSGDGGPAWAAALNSPRSIALWGNDLYIADSDNSRIRHVDLTTGIIDTVVGTGAFGFGGDGGPALRATVDQPRGVAVTPTGDLVIGDTRNARLRLVRISRPIALPPGPAVPSPVEILPLESPPAPTDTEANGAPPAPVPSVDSAPASLPVRRTGNGYRMVASDGGIFAFGDAGFYGSTGAITLAKPIVGMAAAPSGQGYWLVASDGGIFAFGDAGFFGSTGAITLAKPIVGMAATPSGQGYWLVASDGGIFAFGDAGFFGSPAGRIAGRAAVGLIASPTGEGYRVATGDPVAVFTFGDAPFAGEVPGGLRLPVVGIGG